MKAKRKFISLLLAACLILGIMPTTAVFAETDKQIQLVDVGNVWTELCSNAPVPFTGEVNPNSDCINQMTLVDETWTCIEDGSTIKKPVTEEGTEKPKQGKTYSYSVTLAAKEGYVFSDSFKFIYGGSEVIPSVKLSADKKTAVISEFIDYQRVIYVADEVMIENATLSFEVGDSPKFTGQLSSEYKDKFKITEEWALLTEEGYIRKWYTSDDETNKTIEPENLLTVFEEGETYSYRVEVEFIAFDTGYDHFSDNVKLILNGNEFADGINSDSLGWTYLYSNYMRMTPKRPVPTHSIDNIVINNDLEIHVGSMPTYNYYDDIISSDEYTLEDEFWIRDDGKYNYKNNYIYTDGEVKDINEYSFCEPGHSYAYGVKLKSKVGYYFNADALNVIFNGNKVTGAEYSVSDDGSVLTIKGIKSVSFGETTPDKEIDTFEIEDVTLTFNVGEAPVFTGKVPDAYKDIYYIGFEQWHGDNDEGVNSNEWYNERIENHITEFKEGVSYHYSIFVGMTLEGEDNGWRMTGTKLKINGNYVTVEPSNVDIMGSNAVIIYNAVTMTPGQISDKQNGLVIGADGSIKYYENGKESTTFTGMATDSTTGKKYWFDDGVAAKDKEVYDSVSNGWYWFDADGTMATNKDANLPDGTPLGKWVRYDENGIMVKGEDYRYGGWYRFDEITGAMIKGWYTTNDEKIYYYNDITGQMEHGAVVIGGENYAFDDVTGIGVDCSWYSIDGNEFWYEDAKRQGMEGRGKEIYDAASDAWYWLDSIDGGKKAVSKDVYQESWAGIYGDNGEYGKWVRYDENGHMIKGWDKQNGNTYYFDMITGAMAKGTTEIDGVKYTFDMATGILVE